MWLTWRRRSHARPTATGIGPKIAAETIVLLKQSEDVVLEEML